MTKGTQGTQGKVKSTEDVYTWSMRRVQLVLRRVKCGKVNCHRCPHGPYYYLVTWSGGKPKTWYLGKQLHGRLVHRDGLVESMVRSIQERYGVPEVSRDAYDLWLRGELGRDRLGGCER